MKIDFVFDTVCPWCFIGKRRLERALARRPLVHAEINWRPFMLNPDMPDGGIPHASYLERKFGSAARVARLNAGVRETGAGEGIAFDFENIANLPNSLDSHRLVRWAGIQGRADRIVEALFRAYFEHGRDVGDIGVLVTIAGEIGLDPELAEEFLESGEGRGAILTDNSYTHRLSINGVPSFVFEGQWGVAGAQDPDILVKMIDMVAEARQEEPLSRPAAMQG